MYATARAGPCDHVSAYDAPRDGEARMSGGLDASRDTEVLVRELLHEALRARQGGRLAEEGVRVRTRAMCLRAHENGMPIERVLVTLKQEWRATPEARRLKRLEASTILERIVTLCITEFYAEPSAH